MRIKALDPIAKTVNDVLLDGKSVRNKCFEADDEEGWAMLYNAKEEDGKVVLLPGEPRKQFGKLKFVYDRLT